MMVWGRVLKWPFCYSKLTNTGNLWKFAILNQNFTSTLVNFANVNVPQKCSLVRAFLQLKRDLPMLDCKIPQAQRRNQRSQGNRYHPQWEHSRNPSVSHPEWEPAEMVGSETARVGVGIPFSNRHVLIDSIVVIHPSIHPSIHSFTHSFHSIPFHFISFHFIPFHSIPFLPSFLPSFIHSFIHSFVRSCVQ